MPTRITFDITQTDFLLNPNENYTIKFGDGYMVDSDGTANLEMDIVTFNTSPVFITATVGSYYPNEKSLFFSFNKNVSYNAGSIYIYAEDSTMVREIDSTTLSTIPTDTNNLEIPIPFPAEALEDNSRYWVVLDDDLFVSTSDRVASKNNSWTNNRVEFEFSTGAEGLDDFVAWLDASESSLSAEVIKIKAFEADINVTTSVMCHPYKKKAFTLSSPTYQQTLASTVLESYTYRGAAVATDIDNWYIEHRDAFSEDQLSTTSNFTYSENISQANRKDMRSLTVLTGWDDENKQYLSSKFSDHETYGQIRNSVVFGIYQPSNETEYDFYMDVVQWRSGNNSVYSGSSNQSAITASIDNFTRAEGWGNLMVISEPSYNSNRGRLLVYTGTGNMGSGGQMFTSNDVITIDNASAPSDSNERQIPYFGRSLAISHKYVAAANYFNPSGADDYRQVQIYDVKTGDLVQTIYTGSSGPGDKQMALMKHQDTEDYILIGDEIYDITDGSLHQTLGFQSSYGSVQQVANSETHLAISTNESSSVKRVYLFDTTSDSFSSISYIDNPNTNTNNIYDSFGYALDVKENMLIIGAESEDQEDPDPAINYTAYDCGTVYIYK